MSPSQIEVTLRHLLLAHQFSRVDPFEGPIGYTLATDEGPGVCIRPLLRQNFLAHAELSRIVTPTSALGSLGKLTPDCLFVEAAGH
jgi:hypothetical protein